MTDKINELLRRVEEFKPKAAAEIEEFRIKILGKKGELNALMEDFKTVAPELKRELGQQLNKLFLHCAGCNSDLSLPCATLSLLRSNVQK